MGKEFQITAQAPGTKVECSIRTDDSARAVRFARLLAASGRWDSVLVKTGKRSFTMNELEGIV